MIRSMWVCTAAAAVLALASCAATPERFFTLRPATSATAVAPGNAAGFTVIVGPVNVPAWLDRPQWVLRDGDSRLQILEQQRWAQPLANDIAQAVADQLNLAPPVPGAVAVADSGTTPLARAPALRVQIDVVRFESMVVPAAAIDDSLQWSVACTVTGNSVKPRGGLFSVSPHLAAAAADAMVYDQLAAAHADALRQVSREIGNALRDLAPGCVPR